MPGAENNGIALKSVAGHVVPVNVVMGELGAGKTTVIMGLVRQVAGPHHKVIWLKNEYGDVNVDGALAEEQGIMTEEIMNGCLCCTAIGQMEDAIEVVLRMDPDRLIIETAGSAHPAPIAMELKRFPDIVIDSFIEVIDCLNFRGFGDRSVVGQSYARYVDFIVLNKSGSISERELDEVIDRVNDNCYGIPQFRAPDGTVPAEAVLGLSGSAAVDSLGVDRIREEAVAGDGHTEMQAFSHRTDAVCDPVQVQALVEALPSTDVYRVKGIVRTPDGWKVMNSVANRVTWQEYSREPEGTELLFIGPYADDHEQEVLRAMKAAEMR